MDEPLLGYMLRMATFAELPNWPRSNSTPWVDVIELQNLKLVCRLWRRIVTGWFEREWRAKSFAMLFRWIMHNDAFNLYNLKPVESAISYIKCMMNGSLYAFICGDESVKKFYCAVTRSGNTFTVNIIYITFKFVIEYKSDGTAAYTCTYDHQDDGLATPHVQKIPAIAAALFPWEMRSQYCFHIDKH